MLRLARGRKRALILTHDNPDPDSLAAALGLAFLWGKIRGLTTQVAYGGIIGRAENLAFVKLLRLSVVPVSQVIFDDFDLIALVDTQPTFGNHSLPPRCRADVVVDHHPERDQPYEAAFTDVGGGLGATSTRVAQYLEAAGLEPPVALATALFYGIKADTRDLGRETTRADVHSYLWLFPHIDKDLLGQIEYPELPRSYFKLFHRAIERARTYGTTAIVTDVGKIDSPDVVSEIADWMMYLEHMKWSLAFGIFRGQIFLSLRTRDRRMNAGRLVRGICEDLGGSSGGHGSMAGARVPFRGTVHERRRRRRELVRKFLAGFGAERLTAVPLLAPGNETE